VKNRLRLTRGQIYSAAASLSLSLNDCGSVKIKRRSLLVYFVRKHDARDVYLAVKIIFLAGGEAGKLMRPPELWGVALSQRTADCGDLQKSEFYLLSWALLLCSFCY
jgi:hypothetical protein